MTFSDNEVDAFLCTLLSFRDERLVNHDYSTLTTGEMSVYSAKFLRVFSDIDHKTFFETRALLTHMLEQGFVTGGTRREGCWELTANGVDRAKLASVMFELEA